MCIDFLPLSTEINREHGSKLISTWDKAASKQCSPLPPTSRQFVLSIVPKLKPHASGFLVAWRSKT